MTVYIIAGLQFGSFVLTVVICAVRIEHRLTKIETDVSWLKSKLDCPEKGESKNVK